MKKIMQFLPQNTGFVFREALLVNKKFLFLKIFQIILLGVTPVIHLVFLQKFIDTLLLERSFQQTLPLIGVFIALQLIVNLSNQLIYSLLNGETKLALNRLREKLAGSIRKIPYEKLETDEVRDLIQLSSDVGPFIRIIDITTDTIAQLLTLFSLSLLIFSQNVYSLILLILIVFIRIKIDKKNRKVHEKWRPEYAPVMRKSNYFLNAMKNPIFGKEIRVNRLQHILTDNLQQSNQAYEEIMKKHNRDIQKNNSIVDLVMIAQELVIYLILGLDVLYQRMSIGSFAMIAGSINQFSNGLVQVVTNLSELVLLGKFATDYKNFVTEYSDQPSQKLPALNRKGESYSIKFENVSFGYPKSEKMILENITLTINQGEKLALVGHNGAGKTTLVKLLCGFYHPTRGRILLNDQPLNNYSQSEISQIIGAVFQDFKLLPFKVKDVIAGEDTSTTEILLACLKDSGLEFSSEILNKNITKEFDEAGIDFSGGERQKLALAATLYKDAPVIILDEPTAALDAISEYNLYQNFDRLIKGKISVYISHRLSSTRFVDKIAVLESGKLVELGSHEELVQKKEGIYADMFHEQAKLYK